MYDLTQANVYVKLYIKIYAKCDTELKRKAIENAYPDLVDCNLPDWNKDAALLDWLSNL